MDFDGISLSTLLLADADHKLVLPNFQRDFVWSKPAQRDLLASFVADIPIGSILLLQGKKGDFASRPLAFDEVVTAAWECKFLLDGQQRIASLKTAFSDPFVDAKDWEAVWRQLFNLLRNRWFIKVVPEGESDLDLFGWRKLHFEEFPPDLTPQDVAPSIEYRRINVGRPDDWHHPHYQHLKFSGESADQRRLRVGRQAAKEGLVPLWEIYGHDSDSSDPVHYHALREIANARATDLRSETREDQDAWIRLLKPINPSIEEHLADPQRLEEAWSTLKIRWIERVTDRLEGLTENKIPVAEVPPNQPERAIAIFENINLGGTELTVFDLIVAKAALGASRDESLRRQIVDHLKESLNLPVALREGVREAPESWDSGAMEAHDDEAPVAMIKNQFLNILSILGHLDYPNTSGLRVEHIKKTKQLALSADAINENSQIAVQALKRAFAFLQVRCGITTVQDLSYDLMALPVAYCLRENATWNDASSLAKVEYWYWASLFGGAYRERQNSRCIDDIQDLNDWVRGEVENPFETRAERVFDVEDYSDKGTLLLEKGDDAPPPAAVRNGLMHFILSSAPRDLLPEEQFEQQRISAWKAAHSHAFYDRQGGEYSLALQLHHVIPLASAAKLGESTDKLRKNSKHILNSALNLTPISQTANRKISGRAPEEYVNFVEELGLADHSVPHNLRAKFLAAANEDADSSVVYQELLNDRFEQLRLRVKQRLSDLLEVG